VLTRLLNAFNKSESQIESRASDIQGPVLRVLVVGEPGTGKTTLLKRLVEERKAVVISKLKNDYANVKKLSAISLAKLAKNEAEVLVIEDLPAFKSRSELLNILSLQRHLGFKEVYLVTQFISGLEVDLVKTLTHLIIFKSDLPVQKLSALLNNNYQLAFALAEKASRLSRFEYFIVDKASLKISRAYVNQNVESFKAWIENPTEASKPETVKQTIVVESYEGLSLRQKILLLKQKDPSLDHHQIAQILNISVNHAKKELSRLRRSGLIG